MTALDMLGAQLVGESVAILHATFQAFRDGLESREAVAIDADLAALDMLATFPRFDVCRVDYRPRTVYGPVFDHDVGLVTCARCGESVPAGSRCYL